MQDEWHLGYMKHHKSTYTNSLHGKNTKRVRTEDGEFVLDIPRDRDGYFKPKLVKDPNSIYVDGR